MLCGAARVAREVRIEDKLRENNMENIWITIGRCGQILPASTRLLPWCIINGLRGSKRRYRHDELRAMKRTYARPRGAVFFGVAPQQQL